jgi:nucleoside-diphosphate kinase
LQTKRGETWLKKHFLPFCLTLNRLLVYFVSTKTVTWVEDVVEDEFEQTLVLIKPDALKQSLTGYILSTLSEFHTGLRFAATKVVNVSQMLAEEHYAEHRGKDFFPGLIEFITGRYHYPDEPQKRRVLAFVYSGPNAIEKIREIAGPTNPHEAREKRPGCLRSLGTVQEMKNATGRVVGDRFDNLIHASDSPESAEREIKLWFRPSDIPPYMRTFPTEECNEQYYYKDGELHTTHEAGSSCLLAPGDTVWQSDLKTLTAFRQQLPTDQTLASVLAKYLINQKPEPH